MLRGGFSIASVREQFTIPWSNNQGVSINTSVDPISQNTAAFGPAGSVLFSNADPACRLSVPSTPTYPLAVTPGNTINDYNPNMKARYVASWNVGLQRPIAHDTVIEARYVGNRSARTWATLNLNEVNVDGERLPDPIPGGAEQSRYRQRSECRAACCLNTLKSTNFFNQNLPGQTRRADSVHRAG